MLTGFVQLLPPSSDLTRMCESVPGVPTANCSASTYTTPLLSVRTVHAERPKPWLVLNGLLLAAVTWVWVQVLPPSREVAIRSGWGEALPWLLLRNDPQQR